MRCIYCGIEMDQKNEYCQCYDELKDQIIERLSEK